MSDLQESLNYIYRLVDYNLLKGYNVRLHFSYGTTEWSPYENMPFVDIQSFCCKKIPDRFKLDCPPIILKLKI